MVFSACFSDNVGPDLDPKCLTMNVFEKVRKQKVLEYFKTFNKYCFAIYVKCFKIFYLWSCQDGHFTLPHFFLGKLDKAVNQYSMQILSLVTDNKFTSLLESVAGGE